MSVPLDKQTGAPDEENAFMRRSVVSRGVRQTGNLGVAGSGLGRNLPCHNVLRRYSARLQNCPELPGVTCSALSFDNIVLIPEPDDRRSNRR
jgi:hypothetical protein